MKNFKYILLLPLIFLITACGSREELSNIGTMVGETYINEGMGFRLTLPQGWEVVSEDLVDGFSVEDAHVENIDLLIVNSNTASNISIGYESISSSQNATYFLNRAIANMEDEGGTVTSIPNISIGGSVWEAVEIEMELIPSLMNMYGVFLANVRGGYARVISIMTTTFDDATISELLELFEDLN